MRNAATFLAFLAAACGAALADTLTVNNIPYTDVRVTDAVNCRVVFDIRGRSVEKDIADVNQMNLMGRTALNKAEALVKAGKASEAVDFYDTAYSQADSNWLKRLVRYRRLQALGAARMPGRAVADWLAVVDENSGSRPAVLLAPAGMGKRGSATNATAIGLLEGRLKTKNVALLARVKQMLRDLYTVEGDSAKIAMLDGGSAAGGGNGGKPVAPVAPITIASGAVAGQLKEAADQIMAGRYGAAADAIKARLDRYSTEDLATALLLRGRALHLLHTQKGGSDRAMLLEAGLCFMRIAACMEGMPEVPEALYRAGEVCRALGNPVAAQNAFRMLVNRYPDSPWAEKARAAAGG